AAPHGAGRRGHAHLVLLPAGRRRAASGDRPAARYPQRLGIGRPLHDRRHDGRRYRPGTGAVDRVRRATGRARHVHVPESLSSRSSRLSLMDTKQRLVEGAVQAVRTHGIAGVSARTVAAAAGVNQALVFYHFGTVDELLAAAMQAATAERVATYRERFAAVGSLRELLDLGRAL